MDSAGEDIENKSQGTDQVKISNDANILASDTMPKTTEASKKDIKILLNPGKFPQNTPQDELGNLVREFRMAKALSLQLRAMIPYLAETPELPIDADLGKFTEAFAKSDLDAFAWSPSFYPPFIAAMMYHGWLPTAYSIETRRQPITWLFPKLHPDRCMLDWSNFVVHKQYRKKASKYLITVDRAFSKVVDACNVQHGKQSWLYPPLVQAFTALQQSNAKRATSHVHSVELWAYKHEEVSASTQTSESQLISPSASSAGSESTQSATAASVESKQEPFRTQDVAHLVQRIDSGETEIDWNDWVLVAGDLGYAVGTIYVSLTGFSDRKYSSAGSVQLVALGGLLQKCGFEAWDFGMSMKYKTDLGGKDVSRLQLVERYRRCRNKYVGLSKDEAKVDLNAPKFEAPSIRLTCPKPMSARRAVECAVVRAAQTPSSTSSTGETSGVETEKHQATLSTKQD